MKCRPRSSISISVKICKTFATRPNSSNFSASAASIAVTQIRGGRQPQQAVHRRPPAGPIYWAAYKLIIRSIARLHTAQNFSYRVNMMQFSCER